MRVHVFSLGQHRAGRPPHRYGRRRGAVRRAQRCQPWPDQLSCPATLDQSLPLPFSSPFLFCAGFPSSSLSSLGSLSLSVVVVVSSVSPRAAGGGAGAPRWASTAA